MQVGRRAKRGRAIVVLTLDEDLAPEQLEELRAAVDADFAAAHPARVTLDSYSWGGAGRPC